MNSYFHSVTLQKDKCWGCTNCIKRCPTEAIRVRDGKAQIIDERCIDCGECIRVCPSKAKKAITDSLKKLELYKYTVALPAPTLYGQFGSDVCINMILSALHQLGFNQIFEVARAAELVSEYTNNIIKKSDLKRPIISSACPAVLRLIQVRFPEFLDNVIPIVSPMELAARLVKKELVKKGYKEEDIGVFFISPCAAKMTSVKSPLGLKCSYVDGVIAIKDIYGSVLKKINETNLTNIETNSSMLGVRWALSGGESKAIGSEKFITVDGIQNVSKVLEELALNKLQDIKFVECLACTGGCVGGPLTVENGFVAKSKIRNILRNLPNEPKPSDFPISDELMSRREKVSPRTIMQLDKNISRAIIMMDKLQQINKDLPGLDCGSCGAPNCKALAEDIVRGNADEVDCVFKLREKVANLAQTMVELSKKVPPAIGENNRRS